MRFVLLTLLAVGCGSVDRDIEDQITIDQGVYGLLISGCDTSGCQDQPDSGEVVMVYVAGENHVHATVTRDCSGFYQIVHEPGDYTLCTYSCTPITVPSASTVRYDWTS